MPIRWDSLLARHVARELDHTLAGARLRALRLHGPSRDLALVFRDRTLLWRLHPLRGYVFVRGPVEPDDADVGLAAKVKRVYAPADERILRFELLRARGSGGGLDLVVELLGNQWNALVTEGPGSIIRHVLRTREGTRRQIVGQAYEPPRPSGRAGVRGDLGVDEWRSILAEVPGDERERSLVRRVAWTSPLNAHSLSGAEPGSSARDPLVDGHARWVRMATDAGHAEPVVLDTPSGPQPYPFALPHVPHRPVASLLAAFEACAAADGEVAGAAELLVGPELLSRLDDAADQAGRKARRLSAALSEAARQDPAALRSSGDLILARYGEIPAGASEVVLVDFDGRETTVVLDPAHPPHENASSFYARAAKVERARETLPPLAAEADAEHARLTALLSRTKQGSADASEIAAALPEPAVVGAPGRAGLARPYRVFTSSGGLEIRVGRGARHNDDLTFRHSAPNDVWLHARHAAGAHVILRWSGPGAPPARDLEEAATLAALHSKARTSGSVPVDWTLRKHVRKPRGAGPGTVVPERVRTVFVRPDPELAESLAEAGAVTAPGGRPPP